MPVRNAIKPYVADSYYHVYNRGVNKQLIFRAPADYDLFLSLINRYMSRIPHKKDNGGFYPNFHGQLEISSYCLMPNHFHLLIKTKEKPLLLANFMRCLITSYTIHQNKRYERVGHLFQGRYKAVLQTSQSQFLHISRYIHLNPRFISYVAGYKYSSYQYYLKRGVDTPDWLNHEDILKYFRREGRDEVKEYKSFVTDYMRNKMQ